MKNVQLEDPDAYAHSVGYLRIRKFVRKFMPFLISPWTSLKRVVWRIRYRSPEERFTQIHKSNYWANAESLSGGGSTMEATAETRKALEQFTKDYQIRSVLDVPCGDFHWMQHVDLGVPYIGGDIVDALVKENESRYGSSTRRFQVIDLTETRLPPCDLVHTRDCLNHLSIGDIQSAIANISASGARYLAVTDFPDAKVNRNQASGFTYRELNFRLAPFGWPEPILMWDEKFDTGKFLSFWKISDIPSNDRA